MAANGGNYQVENSQPAVALWDDFTKYPRLPTKLDTPPELKSRAYTLKRCSKHGDYYISINWDRVKSRKDVKGLNEVWTYSSDADKNKTVLDAASVLWHAKRLKLTKPIDAMLPYISLHYHNITAASLLIHAVGNPSVSNVIALWKKYAYCCLSEDEFQGIGKALSIALRRTSHWPNGKRATLEHVAHCAYWELAIGRSRNVSDWADEQVMRSTAHAWLKLPHDLTPPDMQTNQDFIGLLDVQLEVIMSELIDVAPGEETWSDFCLRRQSWVSSGSSGGERLEIGGDRIRINKHTYFEGVKHAEMVAWLDVV